MDHEPSATPSPHPTPGTSPKQGLSTGAKFFLGCVGLVGLAAIAMAVMVAVGVGFLGDRVQRFAGDVEEQRQAQETLQRLEREHPFQPPASGEVPTVQADRFFRVTEDLWTTMQPWADELADLALRMEERDEPSITDMVAGFRTMGRFVQGRILFAETLDSHGVSPHEYLWTGLSLIRAHEELERDPERRTVPEANLQLARSHQEQLAELQRGASDGGRPDRGAVFHLSMLWGMTDGSAWQAMGMDEILRDLERQDRERQDR